MQQFQKLNQAFTAIEIENRSDCSEIQAALGEITGATTVSFHLDGSRKSKNPSEKLARSQVPRVFVNGKFIGGGSDVKSLHDSGELAKLLS